MSTTLTEVADNILALGNKDHTVLNQSLETTVHMKLYEEKDCCVCTLKGLRKCKKLRMEDSKLQDLTE